MAEELLAQNFIQNRLKFLVLDTLSDYSLRGLNLGLCLAVAFAAMQALANRLPISTSTQSRLRVAAPSTEIPAATRRLRSQAVVGDAQGSRT